MPLRWNLAACVLGSVSVLLSGGGATAAAAPGPSNAALEGRQLVLELLAQRPAENSTLSGVLKDPRGKRPEIPVEITTTITTSNWQTLYQTRGTNKDNAASLTIIHTDALPNEYRMAVFSRPRDDTNEFVHLTGNRTMIPFAGWDFCVADLGLEFMHWPAQTILKRELRSGRWCSILESTNPAPSTNGYLRVVTWIDAETDGIIFAEAYDLKGKLLKEFKPRNLETVNGQYQVQELQISNVQTGSRTRLDFNLGGK